MTQNNLLGKFFFQYVEIFGCEQCWFPIRYLDILIHYRRFTNAEWKHIDDRLRKKQSSRKEKLVSLDERLIQYGIVYDFFFPVTQTSFI